MILSIPVSTSPSSENSEIQKKIMPPIRYVGASGRMDLPVGDRPQAPA
jgi:hypothetical protein